MSKEREKFGSSVAVMLAMAGSAIGLGNIWRFPYMVGQNGGAAFILVYLFCVLFLSLPIFISESVIGRAAQAGTVGALRKLAPGTRWRLMGMLIVVTPLVLLSYYSVVGGWSVGYFCESVVRGFSLSADDRFASFISSVWTPIIYHTVFLGLTAFIVIGGVKSGIERFNKVSLPLLFVLIVVLTVYSISLPGAMAGVSFLVKPDFSQLTFRSFADAMGQSFFSMSLGMGAILIYASYMKQNGSLLGTGTGTAVFDFLFALLAGFAVMPAVFAAGIEPGAGPGLIFDSFPFIFGTMGQSLPLLSRVMSILFFFTIVIAALTSSISVFEVIAAHLVEEKQFSRRKAVAVVFVIAWLMGILCSLSFGPLSGFKIGGKIIFDLFDFVTSNFLMTIGAFLFVIFVGWKMDKEKVREELTNGGKLRLSGKLFEPLWFMIRYVAPVVIVLIFITNLI